MRRCTAAIVLLGSVTISGCGETSPSLLSTANSTSEEPPTAADASPATPAPSLSSSTDATSQDRSSTAASALPSAPECEDPDQTVEFEPPYRQFATYLDWERDGCLVRIDHLAERVSDPAVCEFNWPTIIVTGDPLGTPYTSAADALTYLRDDRNLLEDGGSLPTIAEPTGYVSTDGRELWMQPDSAEAIFLVSAKRVERWPLGEETVCG